MDFSLSDEGSIFILTPLTDVGQNWVDDNLPDSVLKWGRVGVVVEHRFIADIVDGITNDGLTIGPFLRTSPLDGVSADEINRYQ